MWKTGKIPKSVIKSIPKFQNSIAKTPKIVEKNNQIIYIYRGTTFVTEPGQNRKIAALRPSKCVYLFNWVIK